MNSNIKLIYVDLFCGAGGTSTGVEQATIHGEKCARVVACVNHDANAIASHAANHRETHHFTEDIRTLDMKPLAKIVSDSRQEYPSAKVVLWASLECTNFSRAKGGMPRDADSRTLAEHLFRYIEALKPDFIQIENVEEFMSWGELDENGHPVSKHRGCDYIRWVNNVCDYGYSFTWKILNAADYGLTQAVLEGRKTMTRRLCSDTELRKLKSSKDFFCMKCTDDEYITKHLSQYQYSLVSRYSHGEVVAVAQSYKDIAGSNTWINSELMGISVKYAKTLHGWTNKMFVKADLMPNRIQITYIKFERLKDISDEDCLKEGVCERYSHKLDMNLYEFSNCKKPHHTPRHAFAELIDKVSGKGTWEKNPWVFAYSFELVK